jgi:DNA-binding transcriptional regulator YiaG
MRHSIDLTLREKHVSSTEDISALRRNLGLSQQKFWSSVGVTQSGGSRYERDRRMPKPVSELVRVAHVEQIDIKVINGEDWKVIEYLKAHEPDLYKSLKKSAGRKGKKSA